MSFTGSVTSLSYQPPILLRWCTKKRAQRYSPRTLINAHSPWLPARFTRFPGLPRSRDLVYRLGILPQNISTFEAQSCRGCREKRWTRISGQTDRQTDGQTHAHTHTHTQTKYNEKHFTVHNPRCLAIAYSASMTPSVSSLHYFSLLLNYRETSKLCVVHWLDYQPPILLRWRATRSTVTTVA